MAPFTKIGYYQIFVCIAIWCLLTSLCYYPPFASVVFNNMIKGIEKINTSTFNLRSTERLTGGKKSIYNYVVKKRKQPLQIYAKVIETGQEILYDKSKSISTALVNPNGFPFANLNLDIDGSLLRKDQHHNCTDFGFEKVMDLIKGSIQKRPKEFNSYLKLVCDAEYNKLPCMQLIIDYKDYAIINYKCKKGETVLSIANSQFISEYKIMELNKELDDFDDLEEGKIIRIPNAYAKQIVFYIDESTNLPIYQRIEDELGIFEIYEYSNIKINPVFNAHDFSEDNKKYGF